jgi:hypothetical protein
MAYGLVERSCGGLVGFADSALGVPRFMWTDDIQMDLKRHI